MSKMIQIVLLLFQWGLIPLLLYFCLTGQVSRAMTVGMVSVTFAYVNLALIRAGRRKCVADLP